MASFFTAGRGLAGRWLAILGLCAIVAPGAIAASCKANDAGWKEWTSFKKQFLSADGRVVDPSLETQATTSEGQSYGLFFALVANDRQAFARILKWTEDNLAQGDLTTRLPAWIWGRKTDGSWGAIDSNSASDSDLWIAYSLGEAGRLWNDRRYVALASLLAARVLREETADIPGLGLSLLPGPQGFAGDGRWRLNPSYMPLQLMQWLTRHSPDPRWQDLLATSRRIVIDSAPKGFAPDWIVYVRDKGFRIDREGSEKGEGAYNAIRVYLWAGMLPEASPDRRVLLDRFKPMAQFIATNGYPPESVDVETGKANRAGPPGFSAAVLPFLSAAGFDEAYRQQLLRLDVQPVAADAYYGQALSLFAQGWVQQRYRFDATGNLHPQWAACR